MRPLFTAVLALLGSASAQPFPLSLVNNLPLPGSLPTNGEYKFDHHFYRESPPTVFISNRQNNTVLVIDAAALTLSAELPFLTPKGIWAIEQLGLLVVAASAENGGTVRAVTLDAPVFHSVGR